MAKSRNKTVIAKHLDVRDANGVVSYINWFFNINVLDVEQEAIAQYYATKHGIAQWSTSEWDSASIKALPFKELSYKKYCKIIAAM